MEVDGEGKISVDKGGRDCSSPAGAEEVGPSLKQVMEGVGEEEKETREGEVER